MSVNVRITDIEFKTRDRYFSNILWQNKKFAEIQTGNKFKQRPCILGNIACLAYCGQSHQTIKIYIKRLHGD